MEDAGFREEETRAEDEARYARLRPFNGAVGVILLLQGVLMLALSNDRSLPLTTNYLKSDPFRDGSLPPPSQIGSVRLGPLVAAFLLLSGLALLILTLPRVFEWYVGNLKKGANYARWMEYSITASLMIVVIAMLSGVFDLNTLILIFFLNMMMILFGWMMELHNQTTSRTDWTAFLFGCLAGIVPWVVIALYFFSAVANPDAEVPTFVYFILPILFVFFNIFAINMVLQYKKVGKWADYLYGERVYIILSLLAKSALAWQVFAGTLRGS
ncbi:MAG: heliorhodopsin HeR [Actinobacteria bacterium]|nr:heliorhodopsin HeR [Actinomycetota bacterium]